MDRKNLFIMFLAVIVLFLLLSPKSSAYGSGSGSPVVQGMNLGNQLYTGSGSVATTGEGNASGAGVAAIQGSYSVGATDVMTDYKDIDSVSAASLIPREVVQTEDYGQFSPEKILSNQNYLDPRSQIGYPETIGGVLRNANRDFRSEPINPRTPVSIFNLSTIPPDNMRPQFEIGSAY